MPPIPARANEAAAELKSPTARSNFGAGARGAVEALAVAAAERLALGDADGAFALADRRCRLIVPAARDLLLRARAHRAAGRDEAARRDLDAAASLDPNDSVVDRVALAWGTAAARQAAAARIIGRKTSDVRLRLAAIEVLLADGKRLAHGLEHTPGGVSGWIVWSGNEPLRIGIPGAPEARDFRLDPDPGHALASAAACAAEVAIEAAATEVTYLDLAFADGFVERVCPAASNRRRARARALTQPEAPADHALVTIIVPVYEDLQATRDCLESLARSRPAFAHRIIVIDDASPNSELKVYLDEAAALGDFELLSNHVNAGFAAAVNSALALRSQGDALLLNSDTILAPGAIDRLRALSRSSAGIGTLTPLSNNGELTSYPERNVANPMPSAEAVAALDALARAANGDALVDLPNGVGFCLYITEACLAAVDGLPEIYTRGYYEDVEFCLAARDRGFRNVAATGVFVAHAGSKSFGASKRALVMRNLELIEARFPGYRLETAAFVAIDPLQPFRAALDAATPPQEPAVLLVCGPNAAQTLARRRAESLKAQSPQSHILRVETNRAGMAHVIAQGGGAPQSLSFDLYDARGRNGFVYYLGKLDVIRVELFDPAALPDAGLSAVLGLEAEIVLICGDLAWVSARTSAPDGRCDTLELLPPCEACRELAASRQDAQRNETRRLRLGRALERTARVVPLDRLAETFARRVFKSRAGPAEPLMLVDRDAAAERGAPPRIARLGVLSPQRTPAVDRLLLRIARRLAESDADASLVVFGACVDDAALMATGKAFVTGPARATDFLEMARDYAVDALLAPDRGGGFGDIDAVAAALGLPKAYFDWSFGAFAAEAGDLSLDPRICEDKAAGRIVAWMDTARRNEA